MDNYSIIAIIAIVAVIAIRTLVKGAGRKGCCGSAGDYKPRKKKLKKVIATGVFAVEGMHCEKCADRVMETVNDIPGVAGTVDLKQGRVSISYEQEVSDELIKARIQRLGYTVKKLR